MTVHLRFANSGVYDSSLHCRWVQGNAYLLIVSQKVSLRWERSSQSLGTGRKQCVRKRQGLFMKYFIRCAFFFFLNLLPVTATLVWSHFLPSGTMAPFFLFWILIIIIFTVALGAFCALQTPLAELPMKPKENYKEHFCWHQIQAQCSQPIWRKQHLLRSWSL